MALPGFEKKVAPCQNRQSHIHNVTRPALWFNVHLFLTNKNNTKHEKKNWKHFPWITILFMLWTQKNTAKKQWIFLWTAIQTTLHPNSKQKKFLLNFVGKKKTNKRSMVFSHAIMCIYQTPKNTKKQPFRFLHMYKNMAGIFLQNLAEKRTVHNVNLKYIQIHHPSI